MRKIGLAMRHTKNNRLGVQILLVANDRKINEAILGGRIGFGNCDRHDAAMLSPRGWLGNGRAQAAMTTGRRVHVLANHSLIEESHRMPF